MTAHSSVVPSRLGSTRCLPCHLVRRLCLAHSALVSALASRRVRLPPPPPPAHHGLPPRQPPDAPPACPRAPTHLPRALPAHAHGPPCSSFSSFIPSPYIQRSSQKLNQLKQQGHTEATSQEMAQILSVMRAVNQVQQDRQRRLLPYLNPAFPSVFLLLLHQ